MSMLVGSLKVTVRLYASGNLKQKRSEVKRILARIKQRHPVAFAEVGKLDKWQLTELGFTCVSNDAHICERILDGVIEEIEAKSDAEVVDEEQDVQRF